MINPLFTEKNYTLITFESTHIAMAAEQYLKDTGISQLIIPTPREISASCGLAIKVYSTEREKVQAVFAEHNLSNFRFFSVAEVDGNKNIRPLA